MRLKLSVKFDDSYKGNSFENCNYTNLNDNSMLPLQIYSTEEKDRIPFSFKSGRSVINTGKECNFWPLIEDLIIIILMILDKIFLLIEL